MRGSKLEVDAPGCPYCGASMAWMRREQRRDFGKLLGGERVREGLFCASCTLHTVMLDDGERAFHFVGDELVEWLPF